MPKTVSLAHYVFSRLRQVNCHSLHGVPGDFFLRALDHIRPAGMQWIGNSNELNAGYAADGYARALYGTSCRGVGALMTTYGVGELSAINAVAGSYAERTPVLHLVGTPARKLWRENALIHHTPGDGRMGIYAEMAEKITCAQADLTDVRTAPRLYDRALEQCVLKSKPAYIQLPSDMIEAAVPAEMLDEPLSLDPPANDDRLEMEIVDELLQHMHAAERPLILADGLSYPLDLAPEVNKLLELTGFPAMSFTSGKGIINEASPERPTANWYGSLSSPTDYTSSADLVLMFGPVLSDTNTAGWSAVPDPSVTVSFNFDTVVVLGKQHKLNSKELLQSLISRLQEAKKSFDLTSTKPPELSPKKAVASSQAAIDQDGFWATMATHVQSHDTLIFANGTPLIGSRDMHFPCNVNIIASPLWCSIGQMLPAAQGVALAKRDHNLPGRTMLFEGDGSFQVTCQALSDIIRYRLDVTIYLVNNYGYTYERWLNGMDAEYNAVPSWRYTEAASFMGAPKDRSYPVFTRKVRTWQQLNDVLDDERSSNGRGLKLIEVVMAPDDVPERSKPGLLRGSAALRS